MRKTTPTPQFVADRMADLDRLEREPQDSPNLTFKWRKENGREWLILRNAEGAVDFDLNCAEALVAAAYWKESAAWWKENSTGPHDFPAMESRARTPWTERTPVAVVRTLTPRMDEPPDADHAWVFRITWRNRSRIAEIPAQAFVATPGDILGFHVELLT